MPGRRLNDTERRLKEWWDSENTVFEYPVLKGISINGTPGLRGITDMNISFDYPLTVICGQNGSGKTTLLCLSALAFHAPAGHHSYHARNYDTKKPKSYYTFVDFFFKGVKDPDITGVEIRWDYRKDTNSQPNKTITKQTTKWMKYETRPQRPVHYFGASRVLPAIEKNVLRGHFRISRSQHRSAQLNDGFRQIYCRILGRPYSEAIVIQSDKHTVRSCAYGSSYTSFNMGAGEDILLDLLYYLQESKNGSLIVIEEIELGLHPEAQKIFAKELLNIIWDKKLQVIVSSHSSAFIDNVPRIARVLIQRTGPNTHNVVKTPTTRYAMSFLHGDVEYEITVYCEDTFAERIINACLNAELRKRTNVISVGDKGQVARQCGAHVKANWPGKYLGVFDSDVGISNMKTMMRNEIPSSIDETKINCCLLPDNSLPPERWVIKEILENENRLDILTDELVEDNREIVKNYLEKLDVLSNHHDIGFELSKLTGLRQNNAEDKLIKAACQKNEKLTQLIMQIKGLLD